MRYAGSGILVFGFTFLFALVGNFLAGPIVAEINYPTDKQLEQRFVDKRDSFDAIMEQFQADSHLQLINLETSARRVDGERDSISGSRKSSYKQLMREIGASEIRRGHDGKRISLLVWSSPSLVFGIGGSYKHYVFYPGYHGEFLVDSLDQIHRGQDDAGNYKAIGGGWYLYYDRW